MLLIMDKNKLLRAFSLIIMLSPGLATVDDLDISKGFSGSVTLKKGVYDFFWKYDNYSIIFEVHVKTFGWIGFGLSPNGGMRDADLVIGWVKDGQAHFKDYHAVANERPLVDDSQDWTLLSGKETDTHTILRFKRPLISCDPHDRNITADTLRVIFSYSDQDPTSEENILYHGNQRGTKSVGLLVTYPHQPELPPDAFYIDYQQNNVTIPHDSDTTYWCQDFFAPKFDKKYHFIRFEPLITPGNELMVHHMVMSVCYHLPAGVEEGKPFLNSSQCYDWSAPGIACRSVILAWAIGGQAFNFPSNTGLSFGDDGGIQFLRLEMHYDNHKLKEGVVDSSGLRLWFTPSLRQHDSGMIVIGLTFFSNGFILPKGYENLTFTGHCTHECIDMGMADETKINIFGNGFHTHLLGVKMKLHHYRNGTELKYIDSDDSFDFDFQETRAILPEVVVKKGDNLVLECTYDTTRRDKVSYGGLSTQEEMCLSFVYYYPKIPLTACTTDPTQANIAKSLGLKYETIPGSKSVYGEKVKLLDAPYANISLNEYLENLVQLPDDITKKKFQAGLVTGELRQFCKNVRQLLLPEEVMLNILEAPSSYEPMYDEQICGAVTERPSITLSGNVCQSNAMLIFGLLGLVARL